jgi:hypothetical protein
MMAGVSFKLILMVSRSPKPISMTSIFCVVVVVMYCEEKRLETKNEG